MNKLPKLNPNAKPFYPKGLNPNAKPFVPQDVAAATKIQSAYRGHLGRRRAGLVRNLVDPANKRKGNFDIQRTLKPGQPVGPNAGKTLYRRGEEPRSFTSYVQYDPKGGPIKRVDVTGAPHGGVPTPHVLDYTPVKRDTPIGKLTQYATPDKNAVRPARYWEIP